LKKTNHHFQVLIAQICVHFDVLGELFKFVVERCAIFLATKIAREFSMKQFNRVVRHGAKSFNVETS
jgi:hypothetical protein